MLEIKGWPTQPNQAQNSRAKANSGTFSIFGQTGAPQKGPHRAENDR